MIFNQEQAFLQASSFLRLATLIHSYV